MTTVFIVNGTTSFANPGNWDIGANKIECIGGGGRGSLSYVAPLREAPELQSARSTGAGGGGGAYGYGVNLNPTFPVSVNIPTFASGTTYWNGQTSAVGNVYATPGINGSGQSGGGQGGNAFYPSGFKGGDGSWFNNGMSVPGNGGGGAGGPHGAGTSATTQLGGASDANTVAGGSSAGAVGVSGTQWDATHGTGGGGAGGLALGNGGNGGNYGGGGGSCGGDSTLTPGNGGLALLVVTWTPLVVKTFDMTAQVVTMA